MTCAVADCHQDRKNGRVDLVDEHCEVSVHCDDKGEICIEATAEGPFAATFRENANSIKNMRVELVANFKKS